MIRLNIHKAKTHLSRYLSEMHKGEKILLCKRNIPIAEIVPIPQEEKKQKRPVGLAKGEFTISKNFFKPLPEEVLKGFSPKEQ